MKVHVEAFVARHRTGSGRLPTVDVRPIHGGLVSNVVRAVLRGAHVPALPGTFVVKELGPAFAREADVYELLWKQQEPPPAAAMLGVQTVGDRRYLYLEDVRSISEWPWRDTNMGAAVCQALARLHDTPSLANALPAWDYESELEQSARATLDTARRARDSDGRCWRRLGDLTRVVSALPAVRARLLAAGTTVLHGDVHPGNVILRAGPGQPQVALIDWGRARVGSPLEDVASWLHSLGCWEPQARRRHDTLIRAYLESRRVPQPLTFDVREEYGYASVSNGLSGAIRYHLTVLASPCPPLDRSHSRCALAAWERVVRRAASLLSTNRRRCS